jgi:hypothetical protein
MNFIINGLSIKYETHKQRLFMHNYLELRLKLKILFNLAL